MKTYIFILLLAAWLLACNAPVKEESAPASSVTLPFAALYSSQFTQNVSEQDLLTVLNSYKAWKDGDMATLRSTFADSIAFDGWDGTQYSGSPDSLINRWSAIRDSLSAVELKIHAWTREHSIDKNEDFILIWYTEVDTYKTGKIDSANWHDINMVKNGKISWYAQYRRPFKK